MDLRHHVHQLLLANTRQYDWHGSRYTITVPSPTSYTFQWFWDSCFHSIVWSHFSATRAWEELRGLFSAQRDDGFIPHIIYWDEPKFRRAPWANHWTESKGRFSFLPWRAKPHTSELIQPPVIAQAVERLWKITGDRTILRRTVPRLNAYYQWLATIRDPDHDHLISITTPFESGLDSSPIYDKEIGFHSGSAVPLRVQRFLKVMVANKIISNYRQGILLGLGPFHVEDVLVNSIYALNLGILAELNRAAGNRQRADSWQDEAQNVTNAILHRMWDDERGAFFQLDGREEQRGTILTVASLMPLILPWLPKPYVQRLVEQHLIHPHEFWLPYPVPSVAATEPAFLPTSRSLDFGPYLHWRGSTWMNTNWYLVHGLRQHGYQKLADTIAEKSRLLVASEGFREYYHPYTGQGLAAKDFGWSTLVIDL